MLFTPFLKQLMHLCCDYSFLRAISCFKITIQSSFKLIMFQNWKEKNNKVLVISLCITLRIISSCHSFFRSINYSTLNLLTPLCVMRPWSMFHCRGKYTFFTCGQWDVVNLKSLKLLYLSSVVIFIFNSHQCFSMHVNYWVELAD